MADVLLSVPRRDTTGLGLIDYSLMGFGTALAAWSAGMAIQVQEVGLFSSGLILLGTAMSYLVRHFGRGSKWLKVDAFLYATAGICAAVFSVSLQKLMPEGGFPRELFAAAWLSWMMIFGSAFTWRDSTLLFQAVPAIAMFGLVGCYDTFRDVTFTFFGFLICLATFFARAHQRQMLGQAADSGYFSRGLAPGTPTPSPDVTPGLMQKLRAGPWRWVAGPEWAVASALIVVVISLVGAPYIRISMGQVSGFVKVNSPRIQPPSTIPQFAAGGMGSSASIGRGPVTLTEKPVLEVVMDRPRYLKAASYTQLTGRVWVQGPQSIGRVGPGTVVLKMMGQYQPFQFMISPLQRLRSVPVPGEVVTIGPTNTVRLRSDGSVDLLTRSRSYTGTAAEPDPTREVRKAGHQPTDIDNVVTAHSISNRTKSLTAQVTANAGTDFEKAMAIKSEIESRVRYSIEAPEIPIGADPVDYVLFEQRVAYCDLFASSMVVMARAAGIPARYATGYLVRSENELTGGRYVVQEKDAHAWAELLFEDVGWVIFDATEGALSLDGEGVGSSNDKRWFHAEWFLRAVDIGIVAIVLGAAVVLFRRMRYRRQNPDCRSELEDLYLTYAKLLGKPTGTRRGIGMTADEFLSVTGGGLGDAQASARDLNRRFVAAFYSPQEVGKDSLQSLKDAVAAFRTELGNTRKR